MCRKYFIYDSVQPHFINPHQSGTFWVVWLMRSRHLLFVFIDQHNMLSLRQLQHFRVIYLGHMRYSLQIPDIARLQVAIYNITSHHKCNRCKYNMLCLGFDVSWFADIDILEYLNVSLPIQTSMWWIAKQKVKQINVHILWRLSTLTHIIFLLRPWVLKVCKSANIMYYPCIRSMFTIAMF